MFVEKQFPTLMDRHELDDYLAKGWYRMGLSVFTSHFLFFEDNVFSTVWLRLPLENYDFRKSIGKLLRQNRKAFKAVIQPGTIDSAKEELFQRYRSSFKGRLSATLVDSLLDGQQETIFDTHEVCVYHHEKLVAFSFFDLGDRSLASIKGVYDPNYARYSLGFYTMLEEIQFGIDHQFKYYYPGYFVPGNPRFDYKLRMGAPEEVEFFDIKRREWLPFTNFELGSLPVNVLVGKLVSLGNLLTSFGISIQLLFYPAYESSNNSRGKDRLLESPLFLTLYNKIFPKPQFIVYYDLWKEEFVFTHCLAVEDLGLYFEFTMQFDTQEAKHFLDFIQEKTVILVSNNPMDIVKMAIEIGKLIQAKPTVF